MCKRSSRKSKKYLFIIFVIAPFAVVLGPTVQFYNIQQESLRNGRHTLKHTILRIIIVFVVICVSVYVWCVCECVFGRLVENIKCTTGWVHIRPFKPGSLTQTGCLYNYISKVSKQDYHFLVHRIHTCLILVPKIKCDQQLRQTGTEKSNRCPTSIVENDEDKESLTVYQPNCIQSHIQLLYSG